MKGGVGGHLKAGAIVLSSVIIMLIVFTCTQPVNVQARANLTAYLTVPHTSYEPLGYNLTGTAPWLDVKTVGWDAVKIMGNVGIGDGSVRTLNATSNPNINYTGAYIMAADVSMAPLDPSRMSGYGQPANKSIVTNVTSAQNNTSTSNKSQSMLTLPGIEKLHFDDNLSEPNNNISTSEMNKTTKEQPANVSQIGPAAAGAMALNDPYHSILMGRPVDDLLYEDPLILSITSYARLIGFRLPNGCCVNIGTRCLGYGY